MRHFDFSVLPGPERYRLLASTVLPRPIAWVVTKSRDGVINAAPFSFFNVFGSDKPVVAVGLLAGENGLKDSAANILETKEFVINLVPFALVEAMNATCVNAPPDIDETQLAGLETTNSVGIAPPRITASPVAFECRLMHPLETGPHQWMMVGEVLHVHLAENILTGPAERPRIDGEALDLVGRMHGPTAYTRTRDLFDLARPVWGDSAAQTPVVKERKP